MSRRHRLRRKACKGKMCHRSEEMALAHLRTLLRATPESNTHPMNVYRCQFGAHWHLGHMPKRVSDAIAARRSA